MNRIQRATMIAGAALFLAASIFPPWTYTFQAQGISQVRRPAGYNFLFTSPSPENESRLSGVTIDVHRLMIEYLAVGVAFGALFLLATNRSR